MTNDRILGDRERALEESYFRKHDAALIEKLRQGAMLDEISLALRDKLHVDNPGLLALVRDLGVGADTAPAFLLAPLVEIAWADGSVANDDRASVLRLAEDRGVEKESASYARLQDWLVERPPDAIFDASIEVIKHGFSVLPPKEREERINRLLDACREVAAASGNEVAHLLGLGNGISHDEESILARIAAKLRSQP
ncbi:MAG: hypothetical protein ACJ8EY_11905 [Sphingomicrobium sp.]